MRRVIGWGLILVGGMMLGAGCMAKSVDYSKLGEADLIWEAAGGMARFYLPEKPPDPMYMWAATVRTYYYLSQDCKVVHEQGRVMQYHISAGEREKMQSIKQSLQGAKGS